MSSEQNFSYSNGENKITKNKLCRYVQYFILMKFVGGVFVSCFSPVSSTNTTGHHNVT
jgi:hypothetical protein